MNRPAESDYPTSLMFQLFDAILKLKNRDEAVRFFRDLLTIAELKEFANRWEVVRLLVQGQSYEKIAKRLKISTATVTRVAHWYYHGLGGYRTLAKRLFKKS